MHVWNWIGGFIAGFAANLVTWRIVVGSERRKLKATYGRIAGNYVGYEKAGDKVGNQSSTAIIEYLHANVLRLTLTESKSRSVWEGEMLMDGPHGGSIAWRYTNLHGDTTAHRFGLKRCIYVPVVGQQTTDCVYLIGDPPYGDEILQRK